MISAFAAAGLLVAPASSSEPVAKELCARGEQAMEQGDLHVHMKRTPPEASRITWVPMRVKGTNGFTISASYETEGQRLGRLNFAMVSIAIPRTRSSKDGRYAIQWRQTGNVSWAGVEWRLRPHGSAASRPIDVSHILGRAEPGRGAELLEALAKGATYEFRTLDVDGSVLTSGAVTFPTRDRVEAAFTAARANAPGRFHVCEVYYSAPATSSAR